MYSTIKNKDKKIKTNKDKAEYYFIKDVFESLSNVKAMIQ